MTHATVTDKNIDYDNYRMYVTMINNKLYSVQLEMTVNDLEYVYGILDEYTCFDIESIDDFNAIPIFTH